MKHLFAATLTAVLAVSLYAEEKITDFQWIPTPTKKLEVKDGVMTVPGKVRILSKTFTVDPSKEYTLSLEARQAAGIPRMLYVGFAPMNAKGNYVSSGNVAPRTGTEADLAKPVKKGDKVIWIKANKKWDLKYQSITKGDIIVWNARKDYSDLPNYNTHSGGIVSVENVDGLMKVTLRKAFAKDLPAGTTLRCHVDAGFMYTAGYSIPGKQDFKLYTGKVKGHSKSGFTYNQWPVGTKKFRVVALVNWNGNDSNKAEIKNIQLTVK